MREALLLLLVTTVLSLRSELAMVLPVLQNVSGNTVLCCALRVSSSSYSSRHNRDALLVATTAAQ
jgi:hypothetical protein